MPLLNHKYIEDGGEIGVWRTEEEVEYFLAHLSLFESEETYLDALSAPRKIEWLSSRHLLHKMSGRILRGEVCKDDFGKPFLKDSAYHISISHSRDLVAVIASPTLVGIDIQYYVPRILRIGPRFISEKEIKFIPDKKNIIYHHIIWGAKECLFKAYGKGTVDFRKDLYVHDIAPSIEGYHAIGQIKKQDYQKSFRLNIEVFQEYILVYAIEI